MVSGPVGGGRFSRIPVCILPHSADLPQECSVNEDVGFISVPVHLGPERLYEFVQVAHTDLLEYQHSTHLLLTTNLFLVCCVYYSSVHLEN